MKLYNGAPKGDSYSILTDLQSTDGFEQEALAFRAKISENRTREALGI